MDFHSSASVVSVGLVTARWIRVPCAVLLLVFLGSNAHAARIIGEGDLWRYYKGRSTPPTQGAVNWTQPAFSDTAWGGPAPSGFGYGDNDDATVFSDMQNDYLSVFLRKTFDIPSPAAVTRLTLAVDYDDGFVAYLNGVEVARRNMPGGTAIHTTAASSAHEASRGDGASNPQEKEFIAINPALLVAGTNTLAISGHNSSLGSSDFSLIPELYTNVTIVRGPFLQMPEAGKISVVWRTDALTDSAVDYGADASYADGTVTDSALVRQHVVTLPVLAPGATIFYRVRSGGVTLAEASLKTPRNAAQPFQFAVYGDFGWTNSVTDTIAAQIAASDPDFTVTVGDNIYNDGQPGSFDPFWFTRFSVVNRRAPLFPCLGNHDVNNASYGQPYLDNFVLPPNGPASYLERNYSFDYGNAHFAVVDTNPFAEGDATRMTAVKNWLAADLASSAAQAQTWRFVVWHHPPHTSDGPGVHGDEINTQAQLTPLCAQYGVQMVFQGHNHFYERINAINGVTYITTGAGGRSLYSPTNRKTYSAVLNATQHSSTRVAIDGPRLTLSQIASTGATVDTFQLDLAHPFRIDGLLDNAAWLRAQNGLKLYAAIRGNTLYLATQDAGEGSDHFIYLASQAGSLRAANWGKTGQVMQWSAFLADENDGAFNGWFGANEGSLTNFAHYRSMTSGLNNNGASGNGVLEGTINLPGHFGAMPAQILVAAAPFGTADGGALVSTAQVPAGNGDGSIQAGEFLTLNTRDLALDLPVSNAGSNQTVEAGLRATLDGSASHSPSALPLTHAWSQLSGPPVTIANASSAVAYFSATQNVTEPTELVFRLRVNDGRFDTDATVTITLEPMIDADGDGLSTQEELTGADNVLTAANPNGHITNPNVADSDGDGANDGDEALAATNPNDPLSRFRITSVTKDGTGLLIVWTSAAGKVYRVQGASSPAGPWLDVSDEISAIGSTTSHTDASPSGDSKFYRIRVVR